MKHYKKSVDVETLNRFEAFEKEIVTDCEIDGEFTDEAMKLDPIRKLSRDKNNNENKTEEIQKKVMNLDENCLQKFET